MTHFYKFLFFFITIFHSYGQTEAITVLEEKNSKKLTEEFSNYDLFFVGETHKSGNLDKVQISLANLIFDAKPQIKVFYEYPYNFNDILDSIYSKRDTSVYSFSNMSSDSKKENLFRYLFFKNINRVRFIDCIKLSIFNKNELINLYGTPTDKIVLNDISILKKRTMSKKKTQKKYIAFKNKFDEHTKEHSNVLKDNFNFTKNTINGIIAQIRSQRDSSSRDYQSDFRENYMFDIIKQELAQDSSAFISFNGHFHIPLKTQNSWVNKPNWESLATKTKEYYPTKKICSIYLLNRSDDYLSFQYFPVERSYLLNNTEPGKMYLIKIDADNSPIKSLSDKFTHVLVY